MKKLVFTLLALSITVTSVATPVWPRAALTCEQSGEFYYEFESLIRSGRKIQIDSPEFGTIRIKSGKNSGESGTLIGAYYEFKADLILNP